jgi:beta-lactam-binding protein with PASTA domain
MPNLVGEMLSEARVALADAGLSTGQIHYRKTTTSSPGRIISQSLPPGASVPLESTVDLVISASR